MEDAADWANVERPARHITRERPRSIGLLAPPLFVRRADIRAGTEAPGTTATTANRATPTAVRGSLWQRLDPSDVWGAEPTDHMGATVQARALCGCRGISRRAAESRRSNELAGLAVGCPMLTACVASHDEGVNLFPKCQAAAGSGMDINHRWLAPSGQARSISHMV